jgi:hypothetical protein
MTWFWVKLGGLSRDWLSGFASQHISAIKAFPPTLDAMTGSGLVTLEKVQAPRYGADVKAPAGLT